MDKMMCQEIHNKEKTILSDLEQEEEQLCCTESVMSTPAMNIRRQIKTENSEISKKCKHQFGENSNRVSDVNASGDEEQKTGEVFDGVSSPIFETKPTEIKADIDYHKERNNVLNVTDKGHQPCEELDFEYMDLDLQAKNKENIDKKEIRITQNEPILSQDQVKTSDTLDITNPSIFKKEDLYENNEIISLKDDVALSNGSKYENEQNTRCGEDRNVFADKLVCNGKSLNIHKQFKESDPFSLSDDEEFSPKAYRPLKRKLSPVYNDNSNSLSNDIDFSDKLDNDIAIKRVKFEEEDLCLPKTSKVCVSYVHSTDLVERANKLMRIEGRAKLLQSLIHVYGILQHTEVLPPRLATDTEILGFHCPMYIEFLKGLKNKDCEEPSDSVNAEAESFGLSYDCPLQEDVFDTAVLIAGATITAAESLITGASNITINWFGGWHHAKRDSASGFCYINDVVLGILKLREKFDKVLYVDLDLHHGDGVEEAFYMTPKVMTVSFHKLACGFFPGSGSVNDVGCGRGKFYSVNVPLSDGIRDAEFYSIFTSVMRAVQEKFPSNALVIQCGADTLSEDPMSSFNLTHIAIAKCVCFLLTWNLPTLLLGGGGYNFPNTAKCWTFLTAMAAGKKLPVDIPEHENLLEYGPSYELTTSQGNRKDYNTKEDLKNVIDQIRKNLSCL